MPPHTRDIVQAQYTQKSMQKTPASTNPAGVFHLIIYFLFIRLCFRIILFHEERNALSDNIHLRLEIIFILKHGVMHACADKDKDERCYHGIRNAYLRLEELCIFRIALVYALKKFLSVFNIFRMGVDLIHQPVFFTVLPCPSARFLRNTQSILPSVHICAHCAVARLFSCCFVPFIYTDRSFMIIIA